MTSEEARYLALRNRAARIVSSVHGVIDRAMADEMERLEAKIGLERAERPTLEDLEADTQAAHDGYNPTQ